MLFCALELMACIYYALARKAAPSRRACSPRVWCSQAKETVPAFTGKVFMSSQVKSSQVKVFSNLT